MYNIQFFTVIFEVLALSLLKTTITDETEQGKKAMEKR